MNWDRGRLARHGSEQTRYHFKWRARNSDRTCRARLAGGTPAVRLESVVNWK